MSGQTDQPRPVSRVSVVEALAQIRALCDEREHGPGPGWIPVDDIRAVLDAVSVDATPAQGIDRDALWASTLSAARVAGDGRNYQRRSFDAGVEATLNALVRPVESIVLSREEAATAAACVRAASQVAYMRDDLAALAARLEAAQ